MHPEQKARQIIDKILRAAGWILQDMKDINLGAASRVIVRENPLNVNKCHGTNNSSYSTGRYKLLHYQAQGNDPY